MNVVGRESSDGDIPPLTVIEVETKTASLVTTTLLRDGVDSGSNITASLDDITRLGDGVNSGTSNIDRLVSKLWL